LLKNPFDERLFDYYATGQLAVVDVLTGKIQKVGSPGIYPDVSPSPDSRYLLVTHIKRPYSYSVPYYEFARCNEVWDFTGKLVKLIADLPPAENVPMNGVPVGPRNLNWQTLKPATLLWTEALDGGDPEKSVPYRDKLMILPSPFTGEPREALKTEHRFAGMAFMATPGLAFASEFDWKRRWRTTWVVNVDDPSLVQQIVANAKAAIGVLDKMGVGDPNRVGVGGHSYGAFMTANLLAHCDLFAAGIARSGAYNRTLTPFGFQSERRTLWEARDTYVNMSPFMFADKIKTPILMIHGMADNNSGTFPIQSERLFAALKGFGATARFVYLPNESHGYSARESVLTVLAEMFEWFDKYVKNRKEP
jgi:dipeptidyl aminopeptidase/acylaminoacyl peptidase